MPLPSIWNPILFPWQSKEFKAWQSNQNITKDNMSNQPNNGQRNNNNRNRNNNNRNRNNNNRNRSNRPRKHTPKPLVLSGWQKLLKVIGLFNEDKARAKLKAERELKRTNATTNSSNATKKPAQSNTRVTKPRSAPQQIAVETPRLYVGNLSYEATEYDIEELFKGIGTVKKVEIIYNRHTQKSKGYGFVQMLNTDDAKRAVEVLHEQPFMGRNMIVNGSKAKKPDDKTGSNDNSNTDSETVA